MARRPRDYRAEYRRRIRNAEARGLSRSQARGHPRRSEAHAEDVARASARGLRRPPKPRARFDEVPADVRASADALAQGEADDSDLRRLHQFQESPQGRAWLDVAGDLGLSLDLFGVLATLGVSPRSIEAVELRDDPDHPDQWLAVFVVRGGRPRVRYLPRSSQTVAQLRRTFQGVDQDVEIEVES